jgi:hypothetical protein
MDTFKKIMLVTVATVVAVYLVIWSLDAFGFRSPVFALLVNWLAMSWVAILGQFVRLTYSPGYYATKAFEQNGRVYEYLGIRFFKRLVRRGPFSVFSPTLRFPKEKTIPALKGLDGEMRKAEAGHVTIFLLMSGFIGYALFRGWFDAVGWLLLFNLLINGYPIMLQRYNRIKLQELIHQQGA